MNAIVEPRIATASDQRGFDAGALHGLGRSLGVAASSVTAFSGSHHDPIDDLSSVGLGRYLPIRQNASVDSGPLMALKSVRGLDDPTYHGIIGGEFYVVAGRKLGHRVKATA
jgi:hypothetical protein